MKILAGDIGGTKSELAIFDTDKSHVLQFGMGFLNHEQANLISMLQNFIANAHPVRREQPDPRSRGLAPAQRSGGVVRVSLLPE